MPISPSLEVDSNPNMACFVFASLPNQLVVAFWCAASMSSFSLPRLCGWSKPWKPTGILLSRFTSLRCLLVSRLSMGSDVRALICRWKAEGGNDTWSWFGGLCYSSCPFWHFLEMWEIEPGAFCLPLSHGTSPIITETVHILWSLASGWKPVAGM